jgi:hypothetical protein
MLYARAHCRARQPYTVGERLEGRPPITLQLANEHGVDRIEHGVPPQGLYVSALACMIISLLTCLPRK